MRPDKQTNEIVAICIINFHQRELTLNCLASLKTQTDQQFQVYLLDNDTNGELSSVDLEPYPFVHYTKSSVNTGFAGGNNILIKQAIQDKHPYILLLNNDTEVDPAFVLTFRQALHKSQSMDIIGCVITYLKQPSRIWFAGGRLYPIAYITQHAYMDKPLSTLSSQPLQKTDWITGCVLAASSTLYQTIGLLDESFFAYLEDLDFCLKAKKQGGQCVLINTPLVKHAVSPSIGHVGSNIMTDKRLVLQARNSATIIRRHFPTLKSVTLFLNCVAQCIIFTLKRRMTIRQIPLFFKNVYSY